MVPRRGSAAKAHKARIEWLKARPDSMIGVPGINEDVHPEGRAALDVLTAEMLKAGLVSKNSAADVQRETVRRLVSDLRGKSVEVGW